MAKYRLFVGCSFSDDKLDLRNYVSEQIKAHGSFFPVFGDSVHVTQGPAEKVRELIENCHAALIIGTTSESNLATPWIYSEIGMAYQQRLPIFALVDSSVKDMGITKYAVCYEEFDPNKFTESRDNIWKGLVQLENTIENLAPDSRSTVNVLKKNIATMLPAMLLNIKAGKEIDPTLRSKFIRDIQNLIEEADNLQHLYSDSDNFAEKLEKSREAKKHIADFVYERFLKELHDSDKEIVMDSGTVTFTICDKLVSEACRVRIVTNNIAVGRRLSELPQYPCFILPGQLESRHLASLGEETDKYLQERLTQGQVQYGFIAATSFTWSLGIAGNDPRHASFKKVILKECECAIIVFEGEKIIQQSGIPICASREEWNNVLSDRRDRLYVVTHLPENWDRISPSKKNLYLKTIYELKEKLGEDHVFDLKQESVSSDYK